MPSEELNHVTSRKQQAAETKKRIFAATLSLIEEKGFENVQIRDIQKRANISAGLFYNYFSSKADVLTATDFERTNQQYEYIYNNYLSSCRSLLKVRLFAHYVVELHLRHRSRSFLQNHYSNMLLNSERCSWPFDESRPLYSIVQEGLCEAQEDGLFYPGTDLDNISKLIALAIRGVIFEYLIAPENVTQDCFLQRIDYMIACILSNISPSPLSTEFSAPPLSLNTNS